jgi:Tol biopolymer transport system component
LGRLTTGRPMKVLVEGGSPFRSPRFAPGAQRLAVVIEAANDDIWIYDLTSGTSRRFTFASGSNVDPVWSPDGNELVFSSNRAGRYNLYRKAVSGQGEVERLTTSGHLQFASSWHPTDTTLAFTDFDPRTGADIWVVNPRRPDSARVLLRTPANESDAVFSPDGKWMAYVSDESGQEQVYLRAYPTLGGKEQVSVAGGTQPVWAASGDTLFYLRGQSILGVTIATTPSLKISKPWVAYQGDFDRGSIASVTSYDVGRGGFLVAGPDKSRPPTRIHVIVNWFSELAERMAKGR